MPRTETGRTEAKLLGRLRLIKSSLSRLDEKRDLLWEERAALFADGQQSGVSLVRLGEAAGITDAAVLKAIRKAGS